MTTPPPIQQRYADPVPPPVIVRPPATRVIRPPIQTTCQGNRVEDLSSAKHPLTRNLGRFHILLLTLLVAQFLLCCLVSFVLIPMRVSRPDLPPCNIAAPGTRLQLRTGAPVASEGQGTATQTDGITAELIERTNDSSLPVQAVSDSAIDDSAAKHEIKVAQTADLSEVSIKPDNETVEIKTSDDLIAYCERLLVKDPDNAEHLNNLGYYLQYFGRDLPRAQRLIQSALDQRPDYSHALDSMGCVLIKMERYEEAIVYLNRALALADDDDAPLIWFHLGDALWMSVKCDEAIKYWKRAGENNETADRPDPEIAAGINLRNKWTRKFEQMKLEFEIAQRAQNESAVELDEPWSDYEESDFYVDEANDYSEYTYEQPAREHCGTCRGVGSCQRCSGNGEQTCSYCNGSGEEYSGYSSTDDYKRCSGCSGSGRGRCYACNGSGRCRACSGTGIAGL